ncbi:hypothetical protein F4808DRAFT_461184 [Astrocystis sublimbata]|nr:hypothetical protein F4808DRAFT_461184 [Astrocystis sublimbata]
MAVKERQILVDHCCTFCCKAVDFGTHDYCGTHDACHRGVSQHGLSASLSPLSRIVQWYRLVNCISLVLVSPFMELPGQAMYAWHERLHCQSSHFLSQHVAATYAHADTSGLASSGLRMFDDRLGLQGRLAKSLQDWAWCRLPESGCSAVQPMRLGLGFSLWGQQRTRSWLRASLYSYCSFDMSLLG